MLACLFLFSVAGYFGSERKYFELASHYKVQYLIGSLVCLAVLGIFRSWTWFACALLICFVNAAALLPWYLPSSQRRVNPVPPYLKLILSNVNCSSTHYAALISFVQEERPDVLVVQETDAKWIDNLKILEDQFPHTEIVARGGGSGIAIYSRRALKESEVIFLGNDERPCILASLNVGGEIVTLLAIHPHAPIREDHFSYRNEQLGAASAFMRKIEARKILIGDLNTSLWSPYFSRLVRESGLVDVRTGFGLLPTWPTFMPLKPLLMIPIDHCFVSRDITVVNVRAGPHIGSDHLPLIVELAL